MYSFADFFSSLFCEIFLTFRAVVVSLILLPSNAAMNILAHIFSQCVYFSVGLSHRNCWVKVIHGLVDTTNFPM